jgi:Tfp pilus assembly protein PilF
MKTRAFLLGTLVVFVSTAVVFAPDAAAQGDVETERARGHFQAGSSYFEEGDYESAIREFQRAYDLSRRAGLLYNLALSHERLGHYAEAAQLLRRYLSEDAEIPNRTALERRAERLEARARGETPPPAADPTDPTQPPNATTPETTEGGGAPLPIGSIISFSIAGAGLILYAIAGGVALSGYSALETGCGATTSCTESEVSDVRTMAAVADVGLGVAAVGAAAGAILLVVELSSSGGSQASNVRVSPVASADGVGISIGGVF